MTDTSLRDRIEYLPNDTARRSGGGYGELVQVRGLEGRVVVVGVEEVDLHRHGAAAGGVDHAGGFLLGLDSHEQRGLLLPVQVALVPHRQPAGTGVNDEGLAGVVKDIAELCIVTLENVLVLCIFCAYTLVLITMD